VSGAGEQTAHAYVASDNWANVELAECQWRRKNLIINWPRKAGPGKGREGVRGRGVRRRSERGRRRARRGNDWGRNGE
jgi:hypothetical protein